MKSSPFTHTLKTSGQSVFTIGDKFVKHRTHGNYTRVFIPYTKEEMEGRKDNRQGHIQVVKKSNLKKINRSNQI